MPMVGSFHSSEMPCFMKSNDFDIETLLESVDIQGLNLVFPCNCLIVCWH